MVDELLVDELSPHHPPLNKDKRTKSRKIAAIQNEIEPEQEEMEVAAFQGRQNWQSQAKNKPKQRQPGQPKQQIMIRNQKKPKSLRSHKNKTGKEPEPKQVHHKATRKTKAADQDPKIIQIAIESTATTANSKNTGKRNAHTKITCARMYKEEYIGLKCMLWNKEVTRQKAPQLGFQL